MRHYLFVLLILPAMSHSASLAEQVQSLEKQTASADAKQRSGIRDIQDLIYGRYASSAKLTLGTPTVVSIDGNKAKVRISVNVHLPDGAIQEMHKVINKNLNARLEGNKITYSFDDWCYTGKGGCTAELKTKASPAIWGELSDRAFGIELKFLGSQQNGILIGQTSGDIGELLGAGKFEFEFDVPKASLKNNPKPKVNFVQYRCKWHFSRPAYTRVKTY